MENNFNHEGIITKADTCREFVTPKLVQVGWSISPHSIGEQRFFTNGRIFVTGGKVRRGQQKRADYSLYYRRDFPLAVVEVKSIAFPAETESMLREMRDAAGDSGEFYTPRPVVRFMVQVSDPKLGETVLDPACGTGPLWMERSPVEPSDQ